MSKLFEKRILKYPAALLCLWGCFCLFLIIAAVVPRSAVEDNMQSAAEYYRDRANIYELAEGRKNTLIQDYSNAMWLNVAWNFDSEHPFSSSMKAGYYQEENGLQTHSFAAAVTEGLKANTGYGRYWHGTAAVLKLLLCVVPARGVMIIAAVVLTVLLAAYFLLLLRRKLYAAAAGSALGLVLCTVWVTPMSYEYAPCMLLTFAAADFVLWRYDNTKDFGLFFLLAGALICYFDFLTCEILTFALPMLLILRLDYRKNGAIAKTLKYGALWFAAYALSYIVKWVLTWAVTGESIESIAITQGMFRLTGNLYLGEVGFFQRIGMAITTNLNFVFPMSIAETAEGVWLIFGSAAFALFCVWFIFRKKPEMGLLPLWIPAMLPFARYAALSNHAALHPFFTFRCLFVTVVALAVILEQSVDLSQFRKGPRKHGGR